MYFIYIKFATVDLSILIDRKCHLSGKTTCQSVEDQENIFIETYKTKIHINKSLKISYLQCQVRMECQKTRKNNDWPMTQNYIPKDNSLFYN